MAKIVINSSKFFRGSMAFGRREFYCDMKSTAVDFLGEGEKLKGVHIITGDSDTRRLVQLLHRTKSNFQ